MMNKYMEHLIRENDELKLENAALVNKVCELSLDIGYLRGYIAGRDDACEIEEIDLIESGCEK